MGSVFLGEHTRIKRAVAVKILHEEKADSENTQRFEREAEAAGRIGSDHIVEVLDFGSTPDGDRFMVMEYLDGETLKQRLKRVGRLDPVELAALATQVAEGLGAAHAAGIVHRDLKPDNLFIVKSKAGRTDFMKIVDFGISKFNTLTGEAGGMTKTGAVMGTPYYMSPEQARATNEVDERSDLYSLGVVLYEAVTGAVPFSGNTLTELMFKIVFEEPPHPLAVVPSLDQDFAGLVLKAMARDPARRFQSAAELARSRGVVRAARERRSAEPCGPAAAAARRDGDPRRAAGARERVREIVARGARAAVDAPRVRADAADAAERLHPAEARGHAPVPAELEQPLRAAEQPQPARRRLLDEPFRPRLPARGSRRRAATERAGDGRRRDVRRDGRDRAAEARQGRRRRARQRARPRWRRRDRVVRRDARRVAIERDPGRVQPGRGDGRARRDERHRRRRPRRRRPPPRRAVRPSRSAPSRAARVVALASEPASGRTTPVARRPAVASEAAAAPVAEPAPKPAEPPVAAPPPRPNPAGTHRQRLRVLRS